MSEQELRLEAMRLATSILAGSGESSWNTILLAQHIYSFLTVGSVPGDETEKAA